MIYNESMIVKKAGFTIVELLIVIVVIAIVSAITLVSFTGVQQRARNAQTISGAKEYIKAISMYAVDNESYPSFTLACIGTGYEYEGIAGRCGGTVAINENTGFNAALEKYLPSRPRLSTKNLTISTGNIRAGGYYDVLNAGKSARLYYILEGQTATCDAGGAKSAYSGAPDMFCHYSFPTL